MPFVLPWLVANSVTDEVCLLCSYLQGLEFTKSMNGSEEFNFLNQVIHTMNAGMTFLLHHMENVNGKW